MLACIAVTRTSPFQQGSPPNSGQTKFSPVFRVNAVLLAGLMSNQQTQITSDSQRGGGRYHPFQVEQTRTATTTTTAAGAAGWHPSPFSTVWRNSRALNWTQQRQCQRVVKGSFRDWNPVWDIEEGRWESMSDGGDDDDDDLREPCRKRFWRRINDQTNKQTKNDATEWNMSN